MIDIEKTNDNGKLEYLRKKLANYEKRVIHRYKQYDMKYNDKMYGITIPEHIRARYRAVLGWCGKAVDSLADRLIFREFEDDNFEINEIFNMNNPDVFFDSAILSALIGSCCFVYISKGNDDIPRLQVIEANNATGIIDPITGLLKYGYAILEKDDNGNATVEALLLPEKTIIYYKDKQDEIYEHNVEYPLLVPIIHRPDAVRPFGRSRISRSAMYWQKYAKRTLERADVTAEFYSFPQKYILGMNNDAESLDTWKATITSMLQISKDEEGDKPVLGQFTTASMSPFTEQLRMAAAGFAGETGLTLDDLGFVSDNPSSSEAIKASHETLRVMARKAQRSFSSGLLNVGYLAACLRDDYPYLRNQFYNIKVKWEPVFEPDASTLSLVGDGAIKINQAVPGYISAKVLRDLTGIKGEKQEIQADMQSVEENNGQSDKQANRIISTYEVTSLLGNYQKGVLSKENGVRLLVSMGYSNDEATRMLDETKVIQEV
ncbi:MAG: phage portal protein [Peptoanaerobacter stomatis]|uniref:phage portal protein n=1 Tax=Peptoanaerobacter stomatis TaxID=796937 RepID=UPI003FA052E0